MFEWTVLTSLGIHTEITLEFLSLLTIRKSSMTVFLTSQMYMTYTFAIITVNPSLTRSMVWIIYYFLGFAFTICSDICHQGYLYWAPIYLDTTDASACKWNTIRYDNCKFMTLHSDQIIIIHDGTQSWHQLVFIQRLCWYTFFSSLLFWVTWSILCFLTWLKLIVSQSTKRTTAFSDPFCISTIVFQTRIISNT